MVRHLLDGQHPHWRDLPIDPLEPGGTDHDIYRLGEHLAVRLPTSGWAEARAQRQRRLLPRFAPHLPLTIPAPVAFGHPTDRYPFAWSVHAWLPGRPVDGTVDDLDRAATDLAAFVTALRHLDTTGVPRPRPHGATGAPLSENDNQVRWLIESLGDRIDAAAVRRSWQQSLAAPAWDGPAVCVHGDLRPDHLLAVDGRLSAVLGFDALDAGDPAGDLQPAWNLFTGASRARFRAELGIDDACWLRGRGWALYRAMHALRYGHANPGTVRRADHTLAQVLADD